MEVDSEHGKAGSRGPRLAHQRRKTRLGPFRLGQYGLLLLVLAIADLPLLWIVLTAFKPDHEIIAFPPTIVPEQFTLENFQNLFLISPFASYLTNSLVVADRDHGADRSAWDVRGLLVHPIPVPLSARCG